VALKTSRHNRTLGFSPCSVMISSFVIRCLPLGQIFRLGLHFPRVHTDDLLFAGRFRSQLAYGGVRAFLLWTLIYFLVVFFIRGGPGGLIIRLLDVPQFLLAGRVPFTTGWYAVPAVGWKAQTPDTPIAFPRFFLGYQVGLRHSPKDSSVPGAIALSGFFYAELVAI